MERLKQITINKSYYTIQISTSDSITVPEITEYFQDDTIQLSILPSFETGQDLWEITFIPSGNVLILINCLLNNSILESVDDLLSITKFEIEHFDIGEMRQYIFNKREKGKI